MEGCNRINIMWNALLMPPISLTRYGYYTMNGVFHPYEFRILCAVR